MLRTDSDVVSRASSGAASLHALSQHAGRRGDARRVVPAELLRALVHREPAALEMRGARRDVRGPEADDDAAVDADGDRAERREQRGVPLRAVVVCAA